MDVLVRHRRLKRFTRFHHRFEQGIVAHDERRCAALEIEEHLRGRRLDDFDLRVTEGLACSRGRS